ncbi:MAG: hypothetical protein JNK48_21300 [Bryobacterales bacterium]|nr:hypothetical protein [Bryobacterales bacterium]
MIEFTVPAVAIEDLSDEQVVRRCCDTPGAASWDEFVRRFSPVIAQGVVRALGRETAADRVEEHVQATLARLCERDYQKLRLVRGVNPAAIRPYLRTMGANEAVSAWRAVKREVPWEDAAEPRNGPRAERQILIDQVFRHLQRCTGENAKRDVLIFELYYRIGLAAVAIARTPGIELSQKGVETRLLRMVDCLRRVFARPLPKGDTA